jgi:hypothetical protein
MRTPSAGLTIRDGKRHSRSGGILKVGGLDIDSKRRESVVYYLPLLSFSFGSLLALRGCGRNVQVESLATGERFPASSADSYLGMRQFLR